LTFKIGGDNKFHWGLNIDDIWTHAGHPIPKSVVIPYLFSVRLPGGPFNLPRGLNENIGNDVVSSAQVEDGRTNNRGSGRSAAPLASFLKKNGVDFVRCWFQWNFFAPSRLKTLPPPSVSLSPSPSSGYHFPLDDFVLRMAEAGIGVVGVIGSGYQRFLPVGLQTDRLDEYVKRLTESSTEIVRHYKDSVKTWQIENEPNWWKAHYSGHWRKGVIWLTTKNQEPILSALYSVVRSECPNATIVINLEADGRRAGDGRRADWKLYAKYSDLLGLDFYPNYSRTGPIDASRLRTTALQVKKEAGLPIFIIETGYPTGPRLLGYDESKQSQYVRAACEAAFTCDAITGLGWFRFSDSYWKSFPPQENHFGLLTQEGRPKSGWNEYVTQIRQKR
jgi:hypothetical protein